VRLNKKRNKIKEKKLRKNLIFLGEALSLQSLSEKDAEMLTKLDIFDKNI